jgi:hypothetical protein
VDNFVDRQNVIGVSVGPLAPPRGGLNSKWEKAGDMQSFSTATLFHVKHELRPRRCVPEECIRPYWLVFSAI